MALFLEKIGCKFKAKFRWVVTKFTIMLLSKDDLCEEMLTPESLLALKQPEFC